MILIINICKEKLHYFEFVKPIEDILRVNNFKYFTKHYKFLKDIDLKKADKIVICGTSLFDNDFLENISKFNWILNYEKPILGICGGMQIIGILFGGSIKKMTEIGFYKESFSNDFLGLNKISEVYHLHNNHVLFGKNFIKYTKSRVDQVVKHKEKEIYGVLFHPEVRQKGLIRNFCSL